MRIVDLFLLLTISALLWALVIIIVRRQLHREYPFFFTYVVFSAFNAVFLLAVSGNDRTYAYAYWSLNGLSDVLVLFVLNEALYDVFYRFYSFWWFRLIYPSAAVIICFLAARQALIKPRSTHLLISLIFSLSGAVSLTQCGVFLVLMSMVMLLRVRFRRYPYYTALGLALSSMGYWSSYVVLSGHGYSLAVRYTPAVSYLGATIIWLWCFSGEFEFDSRWRPRRRGADPAPKLKAV